jgi:hypothetical protein
MSKEIQRLWAFGLGHMRAPGFRLQAPRTEAGDFGGCDSGVVTLVTADPPSGQHAVADTAAYFAANGSTIFTPAF